MGQAGLEEHRVHPKLCVQERHIAVHLDKEVYTFVPLVKVRVIVGQGLRAPWASESPPRRHLQTDKKSRVRTQGVCGQRLTAWTSQRHVQGEAAGPPGSTPSTQHACVSNSGTGLRCVTALNRRQSSASSPNKSTSTIYLSWWHSTLLRDSCLFQPCFP